MPLIPQLWPNQIVIWIVTTSNLIFSNKFIFCEGFFQLFFYNFFFDDAFI